jgi:predicted Ser/Thr protein kinase
VLTKGQLKRVIVPGWSQCAKVVVHAQRAPPPQICLATEARLDVAKEVLVRPTLLGRS